MATRMLRVVCYLNQFFGQLGGEEKAGVGPQMIDGAVGAARAVQQALGDAGTVVATVICGDNYAAEQADRAVAEMVALVAAARPDLVVAGPAFLAGRYGGGSGAPLRARRFRPCRRRGSSRRSKAPRSRWSPTAVWCRAGTPTASRR